MAKHSQRSHDFELINLGSLLLRDALSSDSADNFINSLLPLPAIWVLPGRDPL